MYSDYPNTHNETTHLKTKKRKKFPLKVVCLN